MSHQESRGHQQGQWSKKRKNNVFRKELLKSNKKGNNVGICYQKSSKKVEKMPIKPKGG